MKNSVLRVLEGMLNLVRKLVRKIVTWEPLFRTLSKKAKDNKKVVDLNFTKTACELDKSGHHVIKLETGLDDTKDFSIIIDDILVAKVSKIRDKVYFTENAVKHNYELVEVVRNLLRRISKYGKLNNLLNDYFEISEKENPRYDRSYESNIETHLSAVGWQIL